MAPFSTENILAISKPTNGTVASDSESWYVFNHPEFLIPFMCLILASACINYLLMKVFVTSTEVADRLSYLQCCIMSLYVLVNLCDTLARNFVSHTWLFVYCHVVVFFMVAFFRVIFALEAMIAVVKNLVVTQALCMKRTDNKTVYRLMASGSFIIGILKGVEKLTLDTMFVHSCHKVGEPVLYTMFPWLLLTVITIFVCYIQLVYFVYSKTALQRARGNLSLSSVAITIAGGMFALSLFSVSIYLLSFPSRPHEVVMQVILVSIFPFTHIMASSNLRKAMLNQFNIYSYCCLNDTKSEAETSLSPMTLKSISNSTNLCVESELINNCVNERYSKINNAESNSSSGIIRNNAQSFIQTNQPSFNNDHKVYKLNRSKSLITINERNAFDQYKTLSLSPEYHSLRLGYMKRSLDRNKEGDTCRYADIGVDIKYSGDQWPRTGRKRGVFLDPHQNTMGTYNHFKESLDPKTLTVWVTLKFPGRRATY